MEGGPSPIDTFDPKPKLTDLHRQSSEQAIRRFAPVGGVPRQFARSSFAFHKVGQAGVDMCEHSVHLAEVADEFCFYRSCQAESPDHPKALCRINTGSQFGGDPAMRSWVTYGVGSENCNLPGSSVLPETAWTLISGIARAGQQPRPNGPGRLSTSIAGLGSGRAFKSAGETHKPLQEAVVAGMRLPGMCARDLPV